MKKDQLDAFEQSIEDEADQYKPVSAEMEKMISDKIDAINAQRTISINLSEFDLSRLKEKSLESGLSEQMFISSILHQFAVNKLIDEDSVLKTLQLLHAD
jgi:predicted DNA binding CopG/RHH family protein